MALTADEIDHIYTQVALGTAKDDCPFELTEEGSAFWDELEPEIAQLREEGWEFQMLAPEVPDLPPWVAEAPEAKAPPPPPPPAETPAPAAEPGELASFWTESPPDGGGDVPSDADTGRPPPTDDDGEQA